MLITFKCGCIAYAHVPNEKRRKLDDKGEKCIFLGVSNYSKAYKLYNPFTKKIIVSRYAMDDSEKVIFKILFLVNFGW